MLDTVLSFLNTFLFEKNALELFLWTTFYFLVLYLGVGWVFWKMCRFFLALGWAERINERLYSMEQLKLEIKQSLVSILIFGFSTLPLAYLIRAQVIDLEANTFSKFILDTILLTLWNEVHFYLMHRLLHTPFLMKHVHSVHHRSVVPSVFSVYSFHPFEAFLLSSVLVCIAPFYNFCGLALMFFPTVSILINFCGHANYRFKKNQGIGKWWLFATKHNHHHGKALQEYGFLTNFMDFFFTKK